MQTTADQPVEIKAFTTMFSVQHCITYISSYVTNVSQVTATNCSPVSQRIHYSLGLCDQGLSNY